MTISLFVIGFSILVRSHFCIESEPWYMCMWHLMCVRWPARWPQCKGVLWDNWGACIDSLAPGTCDSHVNTLRPRQNDRHIADGILKCIFLNENVWISLKISLKFVPEVRINNIPALVQIMAWRRQGDKPLSEPMVDNLLMHMHINGPQWVKSMIFKLIIQNSSLGTHCEIALRWMSQSLTIVWRP